MRAKLISNTEIAENIFSMRIYDPDAAKASKPGQFLNIKVPYDDSRILRRPVSICAADDNELTVAYQLRGGGTSLLSKLSQGDYVDFIGPLGKGFPLMENKKVAVVGGGIGIFPLLYLKDVLSANCSVHCYLGFRNDSCVVFAPEFGSKSAGLCISTDDGSAYESGFITEHFEKAALDYDVVYTCGPAVMMKRIKDICEPLKIPLYVSLEQRMGCGIGACLVCACKVKSDDPEGFDYAHVCADGPVFDSREVIL